jgi:hypothetical protein
MPQNTKLVSEPGLLQAALEGLHVQRQRLDEQINQVRSLLGKAPGTRAGGRAASLGKRQLSAAARKRIAAAQRKRWAEYRKKAAQA